MKTTLTIFIHCLFFGCVAFSQSADREKQTIEYKFVDGVSLEMDVLFPATSDSSELHPAMVFFFGGGWNEGNRLQFAPQANYFATRGIVCFLVDYRVKSRNGTTPFDALMDAKSAIRFIREHSHRFKIDPGKVIAAGGSAGGQLAAATALIAPHNDPQDNSLISCVPNALVLFNPVIDNGPGNRTFNSVGSGYKDFSPLHNISKGAPPTIIFQGTDDAYTPVKTIEYYQLVMQHVGSRCDLHLYAEQKHGFFNLSRSELFFKRTVIETDKFLSSLGLTHGSPTISE